MRAAPPPRHVCAFPPPGRFLDPRPSGSRRGRLPTQRDEPWTRKSRVPPTLGEDPTAADSTPTGEGDASRIACPRSRRASPPIVPRRWLARRGPLCSSGLVLFGELPKDLGVHWPVRCSRLGRLAHRDLEVDDRGADDRLECANAQGRRSFATGDGDAVDPDWIRPVRRACAKDAGQPDRRVAGWWICRTSRSARCSQVSTISSSPGSMRCSASSAGVCNDERTTPMGSTTYVSGSLTGHSLARGAHLGIRCRRTRDRAWWSAMRFVAGRRGSAITRGCRGGALI